jgi:hypothetical protein
MSYFMNFFKIKIFYNVFKALITMLNEILIIISLLDPFQIIPHIFHNILKTLS